MTRSRRVRSGHERMSDECQVVTRTGQIRRGYSSPRRVTGQRLTKYPGEMEHGHVMKR